MRYTTVIVLLAFLCPGSALGWCTVSSHFDSGDNGWRIAGDAQGSRNVPDWVAGQISALDNQDGRWWYFAAPEPYLGDRSCTFGGTMTFELKDLADTTKVFSDHILRLHSGNQVLDWAPVEALAAEDWVRFAVPLRPGPGWTLGGKEVTAAQFKEILQSLNVLLIRGEYVSGHDEAALRSVRMSRGGLGGKWIPLIAILILMLLGGAKLIQNKRKREKEDEEEKSRTYVIQFTGIDPEWIITEAEPGQVVHLLVTLQSRAEPPAEPPTTITVANRIKGTTVSLALKPMADTSRKFLSEPLLLKWPGEVLKLKGKHIFADYGQVLRATIDKDRASIKIIPKEEAVLPDFSGFKLERVGDKKTLHINPDKKQDGSLRVRFTDTSGAPVADERIMWRISTLSDAVTTATDKRGETSLSFEPVDNGRFAATFDGLMLADGIPEGRTAIKAMPADDSFVGFMETESVSFRAWLRPPTFVFILDSGFNKAPYLVNKNEYYGQVFMGYGSARNIFLRKKTVDVTLPNGDQDTVELKRTNRKWVYQYKEPEEIKMAKEGDKLTLQYWGKTVSVPVYETATSATFIEYRKAFKELLEFMEKAQTAPGVLPEAQHNLKIKTELIRNALFWHAENINPVVVKINILEEYLELLFEEDVDFGQVVDVPPDRSSLPEPIKNTAIRYYCEEEQRRVDKAIDKAVKSADFALNPSKAFWEVLVLESVRFVLTPHIGAYRLVTGRTEDGRKASTLERLVGGIDVLLCLIPIGMGVSRYARAARALRRQARADLFLMNRSLGQAYFPDLFKIGAVTAKQLESRFAKVFNKSTNKSDRLLSKVESIDKRVAKLRDTVSNHKSKLAEAEEMLRKMEHERTLPRGSRSKDIKSSPSAIASKKRNIENRRGLLEGKKQELDVALARKKEAGRVLDAVEVGRYLDRQELLRMHEAGVMPAAFDEFDGVFAWRLYEVQVEGALAVKHPLWAGKNQVFIRSPYRRTHWGKKFSISKKVHVKNPKPDHLKLDPNDFSCGDSKFYFWPEGDSLAALSRSNQSLVKNHVVTIVDTIEKARLSQFHLVGKTSALSGAPASKVWNEVFDLPMVIVTPTKVPAYVQGMIKSRVRGAGRNVKFVVVEPQLNVWADLIPS